MPQCLWEPVTILLHGIDHVGIGNGAQMNRLHLRQSSWAAMRESFAVGADDSFEHHCLCKHGLFHGVESSPAPKNIEA